MRYHFITIEGNIGAGKTTLAHMLSRHYNARLVLEEFADNPFLPKFYENPSLYAFPLELFFMAERYKQNIGDEYLFNLQETYTHYIKQHNIKTLFIDGSNADFLGNEKHLKVITDALDKEYDEGQHYLTLP